jgi:putative tricarboxylic transport membrane protein
VQRLASKDLWSGIMFAGFGLLALALAGELRVGSAARMGPGYVPRLLAWSLIVLGAAIALRAVLRRSEAIAGFQWRPILLVSLGLVAFALLLESTGLLPALLALVLLASLARRGAGAVETAATAVVLAILCVGIFKLGLGMTFNVLRGVW